MSQTKMPADGTATEHVTIQRIAWFLELDRALSEGDYQAASDAQSALSQLGLRVSFHISAVGLPPSKAVAAPET